MAVSHHGAPTIEANLGGVSTTVNLRDWLNTRLSPFLKKAIIESLDSEAEYPLQWLGEHLIEQSILFENNPDSTRIRERFRYNHEVAAKNAQTSAATPAPTVTAQQATAEAEIIDPQQPQNEAVAPAEPATVAQEHDDAVMDSATTMTRPEEAQTQPVTTSVAGQEGVNGTSQGENPLENQDTEMSNAT